MYQLYYTSRAKKDALKIKSANLKEKVAELLALISQTRWHKRVGT
jgi:hypothetical protein